VASFGCREAKLLGCHKQRLAWDANIELMFPLFAAIEPPQSEARRSRAAAGGFFALKTAARERRVECSTHRAEEVAQEALVAAAGVGLSYFQKF